MTEAATAIREVEAPRKRTTAGRLRSRYENKIEAANSEIKRLQDRVEIWQEIIADLNTEPAE